MKLQTGSKNGHAVEPGAVNSNGDIIGLTDLFAFLSHLEHSEGMYQKTMTANWMAEFLATYGTSMPNKIIADILEYAELRAAYDADPSDENEIEVLKVVKKIQDHASDEVGRMWDILKMC